MIRFRQAKSFALSHFRYETGNPSAGPRCAEASCYFFTSASRGGITSGCLTAILPSPPPFFGIRVVGQGGGMFWEHFSTYFYQAHEWFTWLKGNPEELIC